LPFLLQRLTLFVSRHQYLNILSFKEYNSVLISLYASHYIGYEMRACAQNSGIIHVLQISLKLVSVQ